MRFAAIIIASFLVLTPSTNSYAEITGFIVNSIEGLDNLSLNSRFGTSPSDIEHQINYEDCLEYNGEQEDDGTGSVSSALEADSDAASSSDDIVTSDVVVDVTEEASEPDLNSSNTEETNTEDTSSGATDATDTTESTGILPDAEYVRFDVGMPSQFGLDWYYTVRMGNCDSNASLSAAASDSCIYLRQKSDLSSFSSISFDVNIRYLLGTKSMSDGSEQNCSDLKGTKDDVEIYIAIEQDGNSLSLQSQQITIEYDYDSPSAPTDVVAAAGESNVDLSWSDDLNSSETDVSYRVYYAESSFTADDLDNVFESDTTQATSIEITGLELGETYYFRVATLDSFENISPLSDEASAAPIAVNDFFEEYAKQGGREEGGFCAINSVPSSANALMLLTILLATLLIWRRRTSVSLTSARPLKTLFSMVFVVLIFAAPNTGEASRESPRLGTANFRFGTYLPEIDSEFSDGLATPYGDVFGDGKMWLFRAEAGYLIFDKFGSVFLTTEVGYGSVDGKGIESATGEFSSDETSMNFLPISVNLIYQFDILARHTPVPLVPYAKAGYDYWIWWITDGAGDVSDRSSLTDSAPCEAEPCAPAPDFEIISDGMGGTQGYHFGGGIRLLLDGFASKMAKDFDNEMGFNDSYLFAEMTIMSLDDFGSDSSFILSDTLFSFGLGFDF